MLLDNEQVKKNLDKISAFIEYTDLENVKEQLLDMFYAAITSDRLINLGIGSEIVLTNFYKQLLGLIDSIHWLGVPMIEIFRNSLSDDMFNLKIPCPYKCHCTEE